MRACVSVRVHVGLCACVPTGSPTSPVFCMRNVNQTSITWPLTMPLPPEEAASRCRWWHEELGRGGTGGCSLRSERHPQNGRHYDVNHLLRQKLRPARPGHPPHQQSSSCTVSSPPSVGPSTLPGPGAASRERTAHQGGEAVAERAATAQDKHHHNGMRTCTTPHSLQSSVPREASFHPQGHQEGWVLASLSYPENRRRGGHPRLGPGGGERTERGLTAQTAHPAGQHPSPGRCGHHDAALPLGQALGR